MKNRVSALLFATGLIGCVAFVYPPFVFAADDGLPAVEDRLGSSNQPDQSNHSKPNSDPDKPMWLLEEEHEAAPAAPVADTPAAKMDFLQQQIQELRGKVEIHEHRIQELSKQLSDQFQDLDERLKKLADGQKQATATSVQEPVVAVAPAPAQVVPAPASVEDEKTLYHEAHKLAQEKKYDQSIEAFKKLVQTHPKSTYVPTAYFWMGEIYILQSKYDQASDSFNQIVLNYSSSPKVSEAIFKMGYIAYARGDNALAAKKFNEVKKRFPGTAAAKQADHYLRKMKTKKA